MPVTIEAGRGGGVDIIWNGGKLHYAGKDLVVYGGADNYGLSHVTLNGGTVAAIYGGSFSGVVGQSVILLESGWVTGGVYGGGPGTTRNARIVVRGGNYNNIFGGGIGPVEKAEIVANGGIIQNLYAGGKGGNVGQAVTEIGAASIKTVTAGGLWSATSLKSIKVELGRWFGFGWLEEGFGNVLEEAGRLESFEFDFDEEPCISVLQYRRQEAYEDHWDDVVNELYDLRSGQVLEVDYNEEYPDIPFGVFDHVLDSGMTLNIENRGKYEYTFAPENLPAATPGRVVWKMGSLVGWRSLMPTA